MMNLIRIISHLWRHPSVTVILMLSSRQFVPSPWQIVMTLVPACAPMTPETTMQIASSAAIALVQGASGNLNLNAFLHSMLPASKENLGPVYSRTSIFNTSEDLIDVASTTTFIRQWTRLSGQKTTSLLTEPPGDSSQGSFGCSGTGPMRTSP